MPEMASFSPARESIVGAIKEREERDVMPKIDNDSDEEEEPKPKKRMSKFALAKLEAAKK